MDPNDKRGVNYEIMKNKGLTPSRNKEQRNPRVRQRKKYERSMTKLKSFKSVVKSHDGKYGGEETGIKKNLAKSVRFN
jgi:U3 small nucleolar RNA-associated protein 3